MGYDIIGDLHGHADLLVALLKKMDYRKSNGAWRHPERQAIFVGDFIDRGPKQIETVMTVRRMIDAGSALAVMGNHEFNAIAWYLPDPAAPGDYLRSHFDPKRGSGNRHQHAAFLAEVEHDGELHRELVEWFLTLPLRLDLPHLRIVHACWHSRLMDYLEPTLSPGWVLTRALMVDACRKPSAEKESEPAAPTIFQAVDAILKGIELPSLKESNSSMRMESNVAGYDRGGGTARRSPTGPRPWSRTLCFSNFQNFLPR
jgi:hypothetical protein